MWVMINPTQGRLFLLAARHNPSKTWLLLSLRSVGWNLYPQFIAWVAYHLLYQHRSSYALKHSFCYFLALKSSAKRRSVNHCRDLSSKFPKTDATHFWSNQKVSVFLTEISSSALPPPMLLPRFGNSRWKMRDERWKRKHVIPPSLIRRGMESLTEDSEGRDDIQLSFNSTVAWRF